MSSKRIKILALTLVSIMILASCNKAIAPTQPNTEADQLTGEEIEESTEGSLEEGSAEDIATDKAALDKEADEKQAQESKNASATKLPNYIAYNETNLKTASSKGPAVLFFHASWCPSCQALDKELKAKGSEIPAGVTVLDVDYDSSDALKKQFSIVQQHTLVQLDKDGKEVTRWIGGGVDTFKEKIKQ